MPQCLASFLSARRARTFCSSWPLPRVEPVFCSVSRRAIVRHSDAPLEACMRVCGGSCPLSLRSRRRRGELVVWGHAGPSAQGVDKMIAVPAGIACQRTLSVQRGAAPCRPAIALRRSAGRSAFVHTQGGRAVLAQATTTDVAELNKKFGIKDHVQIMEGRGGLPMVRLTHSCGASADVYLFGGCVISWKQANGSEVLYVRPDAVFDKSKPISGGIPHCFPQFGPGAMQQHGFARNLDWAIGSTSADVQPDERDPEVELVLTPNDYTTKMWPFKFRAVYTVTLHGETLKTDFRVINEDTKPFTFTAALHSYFEVADITKAAVRGLKGLSYLDKVADPKNPAKKTETADKITFSGPKDSVYLNAGDQVELDVGTGAAVAISSDGWKDVVVWSPWTAMEACYKEFCCVERGVCDKPVEVKPGESWRARMDLSVVDL